MELTRTGMFGPIQIRDTPVSRQLLLNGQVQGASYLDPSAAAVDNDLSQLDPGPVSESSYALGWLIAGAMNPTGTGLMIGLGSGAGAVQLLYNFPALDLTVVEIDPVMVQVALEAFPLLDWYLDRGQLNIVIEDAGDYLRDKHDVWDFMCLDAYTGSQELHCPYLDLAVKRADHLYLNVIDRDQGPVMLDIVNKLWKADKPVTQVLKCSPFGYFIPHASRSNWIATTQELDWSELVEFEPNAELSNYRSVALTTAGWDDMLASVVD